jgi:uncharacterized protein (DUF1778 family)
MNSHTELDLKPVPINMRVDSSKRNLIDMAAEMLGRDRTNFIMEAACKYAEQVILEKRLFLVENSEFDAFEKALEDNPIGDNKCLLKLLQRPNRWGSDSPKS